MKLHELHDNPGAAKKQKRVARGPGSGKGKTAGRGIKGQKSRSGVALNAYEGGQMPLYMRLPKRGFNKPNRKDFAVINLGLLQKFVDAGKLDAAAEITEEALVKSGLVRRQLDGVRLLGKGELTAKLTHDRHRRVEVGRRGGREGRRHAHRHRAQGGTHGREAARPAHLQPNIVQPPRRCSAAGAISQAMNFAPPRPVGPAAPLLGGPYGIRS